MSDTYQPIFDAVRSKLSNADIGSAVENAIRDCNLSHYFQIAASTFSESALELQRPSVLYRPALAIDGNMWEAMYGVNPMEGVCGYGESPAAAMLDFDKNWYATLQNVSKKEK